MRPNLITRLKEEWNNLDPVDPLRGLIADAIDALVEAQPSKPWVGLTDEEILVGAQALCQQMAEACNVDAGDQWQLYADTFKEDAKAVLTAVAKLREKNA